MTEEEFKQQHDCVVNWFDHVIRGYVKRDLEKLLSLEVDSDGYGGCAAPLAMTVLAVMDRLGYLTKRNEKDLDKTERRIKDFCKQWMAKVDRVYDKGKTRTILAEIFRHGLAHQFLSRSGSGISRNDQFREVIVDERAYDLFVLQPELLAGHLLKVIDLLAEALGNPDKKELITAFFVRLRRQQEKDLERVKEIRRLVEKKRDDDYEIPSMTLEGLDPTISGSLCPTTTETVDTEEAKISTDQSLTKPPITV